MNQILTTVMLFIIFKIQLKIWRKLRRLERLLEAQRLRRFHIVFTLIGANGEIVMQMLDNQSVTASISETDAAGFPVPAQFDAPPAWAASPSDGVDLTPSDDGLSCQIKANGKAIGDISIQMTATIGGNPVSATGTLTVQPGQPVNFAINFAAPVNN